MGLPNQSLLDTKIQQPPETFARMMREGGPCYWWERGGFWLVTDFGLASEILKNPDFSCDRTSFISRMPNLDLALVKDFFGVVGKMMVMSDGQDHLKRRKIASLGLADEVLDRFLPTVERTVDRLIDGLADKPSVDFVADIARALPSVVLADLFGIREQEREDFYRWSNNMTQFFGGSSQYRNEDGVEVNYSASRIRDYFVGLMGERRAQPREDFLSVLLKHQAEFGLEDAEVVSQAVMMLVAGQVTTTDQMANNLFSLLSRPSEFEALRNDPGLLRTGIEELNRLDPAVTFIFRVAGTDTRIGSQPIPKGAVIFLSTHAINRDPAVFEDPDRCRLDRRPNPHFAYGFGPHVCLGAKLARLEMLACFGRLLARFPNLNIDPARSVQRKHHSLAFSGFETLPLNMYAPPELRPTLRDGVTSARVSP